jgi:arylsulfatase A-like enzyme
MTWCVTWKRFALADAPSSDSLCAVSTLTWAPSSASEDASTLAPALTVLQGFSEIQTPHLDALSRDGFRLVNYHTAAACSPTRAMVLSGTDAHLGGLGCLIEYKANPKGQKRWAGKAGYEGYLNHEVGVLPEILEDEGYHTILAGKVSARVRLSPTRPHCTRPSWRMKLPRGLTRLWECEYSRGGDERGVH